MTGQDLFELWRQPADIKWHILPLTTQARWDRLAAEVVPVSEVVAAVRRYGVVPGEPENHIAAQYADFIEARFAPGTGEEPR